MNGPGYISSAKERLEGYKRALRDKNVGFDPSLVVEIGIRSGETRQLVRKMLEDGIEFSAIFAFSDMIAWEAIFMLQKMGHSIPKDFNGEASGVRFAGNGHSLERGGQAESVFCH